MSQFFQWFRLVIYVLEISMISKVAKILSCWLIGLVVIKAGTNWPNPWFVNEFGSGAKLDRVEDAIYTHTKV